MRQFLLQLHHMLALKKTIRRVNQWIANAKAFGLILQKLHRFFRFVDEWQQLSWCFV